MNTFNRKEIGNIAEQQACSYLQKQGLELITRNYRCYYGEVDLIMRDKKDIVFVEVRLRSRTDYGLAIETVNRSKQRKVIRTATHFLQKKGCLYKVCSRFDVVTIERRTDKWQLEWFKNAFLAEY